MDMAGSGLNYRAEDKPASGQAPDDLNFLTQIWMNHSNNSDHLSSFGVQSASRSNGTSLPSSPATSTALPAQSTLSASDAILNAGQLRKEPPRRAAGAQSQSGDALLQAFSELPQQQSLKVNTAQLGGANGPRASLDSQRANSPFWMRPPSQGPVASQVMHFQLANIYSITALSSCISQLQALVASYMFSFISNFYCLRSGSQLNYKRSCYLNWSFLGTATVQWL